MVSTVGTSEAQVRTATQIDWSHKGLDEGDAKVIAYLLAKVMASLKELYLRGNSIGDTGAAAIANAIAVNASLKLQKLVVPHRLVKHPQLVAACREKGVELV